MMKKTFTVLLFVLFSYAGLNAQDATKPANLLIRCDDIGMSHSVNAAAKELIDSGIPFSASIMFVCPWYQEAVDLLKANPQISVGIHLVLNAEWKNYRWGPVSGKDAVPSLVDSCGYFFPSRASLYAHNPKVNEIEKELRAQLERAVNSGIKIDYMDYHMGTAVDKPEYRAIVEKLSKEYNIGISRYFGEEDCNSMYDDPIESKIDTLHKTLNNLSPDKINLLVCHIGKDYPELQAMVDLNTFGLKEMSKHRQAELKALIDPSTKKMLNSGKFNLITYRQLIENSGLSSMKRPADSGY